MMGAHDFSDSAFGATAEEAFQEACDQAIYEYGHQPYNGTISTNSSFIEIPLKEGETREQWEARVVEDEQVGKWGPCACVKDPDCKEANGRWFWWFAGWAAC